MENDVSRVSRFGDVFQKPLVRGAIEDQENEPELKHAPVTKEITAEEKIRRYDSACRTTSERSRPPMRESWRDYLYYVHGVNISELLRCKHKKTIKAI